MKIVYLGSDVAMPVLEKLFKSKHEILAVVCNVDKVNARGNKIIPSKTKEFALEKNLKILQYRKIRVEGYEDIKALEPDLIISAAFGQIISQEIIDISKVATLNVHPSLLPKYRGPSPIVSAIASGDETTGVSIMKMALEVDAGPIYLQKEVKIEENEKAGELTERLFKLGADMLIETIDSLEKGTAVFEEQKSENATFCKMVKEENAEGISTTFSYDKAGRLVKKINNKVRAYNPTPVCYFVYKNEKYKVFESEFALSESEKYNQICEFLGKSTFSCGEIVFAKAKPFGLVIKALNGFFMPKVIQAPNGKVLDIKSFLNGKSFEIGEIIWKRV